MYAEKVIATAVRYLQWEPHDPITWGRYVNLVNPFLNEIVAKRGITSFKVKCDAETNTAYYINQGQMVAELHIIPTNAVAVIVNRYIIHPHGAQLETSSAGAGQTIP
jgi:phage tail sheath protein FI